MGRIIQRDKQIVPLSPVTLGLTGPQGVVHTVHTCLSSLYSKYSTPYCPSKKFQSVYTVHTCLNSLNSTPYCPSKKFQSVNMSVFSYEMWSISLSGNADQVPTTEIFFKSISGPEKGSKLKIFFHIFFSVCCFLFAVPVLKGWSEYVRIADKVDPSTHHLRSGEGGS